MNRKILYFIAAALWGIPGVIISIKGIYLQRKTNCMNFNGIIVGAAVFLSIGICHPLVIKMEYKWGRQSWWVWLVAGLLFCGLSLFVRNDIISIIIGGFAFCCLWGIHEMFLQEKRVLRGWFPENPSRHEYYENKRRQM